jgi:tetratricopeptide (TPR) repeat protein
MSSETADLLRALPVWVASTRGQRVTVPRSADLERLLEDVRPIIRDQTIGLDTLGSNDHVLGVLSLLGSQHARVTEPSAAVFEEAAGAFDLLTKMRLPDDEFGEVTELLCRFAFTAWRHARGLGKPRMAQQWLERHDGCFARPSVERQCLDYFLATPAPERSRNLTETFLRKAETLFCLCSTLREKRNVCPSDLGEKMPLLYKWLSESDRPKSFPDEREYFLGQMALTASTCARLTGNLDSSFAWNRRAETDFEATLEPDTGKAEIGLLRLINLYDMGSSLTVLEALPALERQFRDLGMATPLVKAQILHSAALKKLTRFEESVGPLEQAITDGFLENDIGLKAFVLESLGESYALVGRFDEASSCINDAMALLRKTDRPIAVAWLKLVLGEVFRIRGELARALEAYREAERDYGVLNLPTWIAYARLLSGEVLLALNREVEAEAVILDALPALEERRMVPEGLAAVALLRESMRRRKTDRNALRELREHLQGRR